MAVEDSKKADLRPIYVLGNLILWLKNVEDYANPILVVVSNNSLVGVCSV